MPRQVTAVDSTELGTTALAGYYSSKGEARARGPGPGWSALMGLEPRDVVTAEQMGRPFGSDLITRRAYRIYSAEGVDGFKMSPRHGGVQEGHRRSTGSGHCAHTVAGVPEWFVRKRDGNPRNNRELTAAVSRYTRPRLAAVSVYDLTFSPVKSLSTLWAVAPPEIARAIEVGHALAVGDAMRILENHV